MLQIEVGRWSGTPIAERLCKYCDTGSVDNEFHFLLGCPSFAIKRNCFLGKMGALGVSLDDSNTDNNLSRILCPLNPKICKTVNKYIGILFNARKMLDEGTPLDQLFYRNVGQIHGDLNSSSNCDSFNSSFVSEISDSDSSVEDYQN